MFSSLMRSFFGSANDRLVKQLTKVVVKINALESHYQTLTDASCG